MKYTLCLFILLTCAMLIASPGPHITGTIPGPTPVPDYWSRADSLHGFDVLHYDVDLHVNHDTRFIEGTVTTTLLIEQQNSEVIYSLAGDFEVTSMLYLGEEWGGYSPTDNEIYMGLIFSEPGEIAQTTVAFHGIADRSDDGYNIGMIFDNDYVFTLSDPSGLRWWLPVYDHPWDKATWDLTFTIDEPWTIASNGVLDEWHVNDDGSRTYHWIVSDPTAPHLICFTAADFVEIDQTVPELNDLPVQNFVTAPLLDEATADFAALPEMIRIYSERYGDYPFEKYGNAVVPMVTYGAMEHQTMTTLGNNYITGDNSGAPTIAHELAHSWFGNAVTPLTWKDVWLSESFATYSEAVYVEATQGQAAMDTYIQNSFHNYYLNWESASNPPTIYDPAYNEYFNPQSYEKGASVLHELRLLVGDENFFNILRAFFTTFSGGYAVTAEFQAIAESVSGLDLEQFFQQWIYEPGVPYYEYALFLNHDNHTMLPVIHTYSPTGTQFTTHVPLRMTYAANSDDVLVTAVPAPGVGDLVALSDDPLSVTFDPRHALLTRGVTEYIPTMQFAMAANERAYLIWQAFPAVIGTTGYRVYRAESETGPFTRIGVTTGTQYSDSTMVSGTTYWYAITAVRGDYETLRSTAMRVDAVTLPMDQGILVVDETWDGNGGLISPTDAEVDEFYSEVIPRSFTPYDYATQGAPSIETLGQYSTVIWHGDDSNDIFLDNNEGVLAAYLIGGGHLIISEWKAPVSISNSFMHNILKAGSPSMVSAFSFTTATGEYPTLSLDFSKVPENWSGLPFLYTFTDASHTVYSSTGVSCGIRNQLGGTVIFLGFPLYYMQPEGVTAFFTQALAEFGEASTDEPELNANSTFFCYPNPARGSCAIAYDLPSAQGVRVDIYNIRGERVITLDTQDRTTGRHVLTWNGCDERGREVAAGVYFTAIRTGPRSQVRKIVLMK